MALHVVICPSGTLRGLAWSETYARLTRKLCDLWNNPFSKMNGLIDNIMIHLWQISTGESRCLSNHVIYHVTCLTVCALYSSNVWCIWYIYSCILSYTSRLQKTPAFTNLIFTSLDIRFFQNILISEFVVFKTQEVSFLGTIVYM